MTASGAKRTLGRPGANDRFRRIADVGQIGGERPLLTQSGHSFCLILRITAAMAAGVSDRMWSLEELVEQTSK
jgi:hypothetical protein